MEAYCQHSYWLIQTRFSYLSALCASEVVNLHPTLSIIITMFTLRFHTLHSCWNCWISFFNKFTVCRSERIENIRWPSLFGLIPTKTTMEVGIVMKRSMTTNPQNAIANERQWTKDRKSSRRIETNAVAINHETLALSAIDAGQIRMCLMMLRSANKRNNPPWIFCCCCCWAMHKCTFLCWGSNYTFKLWENHAQ